MQASTKKYSIHILYSFVVLITLSVVLFLTRNIIKDIVVNPPESLMQGNSLVDFNFNIIFFFIIIFIVLISFIFYLIISSNSRLEVMVWNETKTLSFSKQQFKRLYESAPIPYLMLDKDGKVKDPNKATLRFFGVFAEEIVGKDFFSLISGEYLDKAEDFLNYYKSKQDMNRREAEMITKNGSIKSVLLSIFDMHGPGSISREGLVVIVDITEQKIIEKTKTEFLSLASHQLKTPLVTTKWYIEMLMSVGKEQLTADQKNYIEVLNTSNQNMIELVDVLLNISRIEMGSLKMEKVLTNVKDLSESVLKELSLSINNKKINIQTKYNNLFENIMSDPKLLRIVIQNLISNAVKYTTDGGTISVSFEENGNDRRIIVADTGLGIPKSQQDKIFSKSFRADNVKNSSTSQGTGLGLYLVKSIAVSMGGDITFTSEENKGSVFTIKF